MAAAMTPKYIKACCRLSVYVCTMYNVVNSSAAPVMTWRYTPVWKEENVYNDKAVLLPHVSLSRWLPNRCLVDRSPNYTVLLQSLTCDVRNIKFNQYVPMVLTSFNMSDSRFRTLIMFWNVTLSGYGIGDTTVLCQLIGFWKMRK